MKRVQEPASSGAAEPCPKPARRKPASGGNVIAFPKRPNPRGEVYLFPCELHGGSWGVEHISASGDSAAFLGAFFSFGEAVRHGRAYAAQTGADFEEGASS